MDLVDDPLTYNERRLIELVFRGTATSRPDIAKKTGLTSTTITRLVTGMLDKGLLSEAPERVGAMGQPVRKLSLVKRKAFSIGVNFMRRRFDLALVDLTGDVINVDRHEIEDITPASIAEMTSTSLRSILKRSRVSQRQLIGAGFSVPGNFAPDGVSLRAHDYFAALDGRNLVPVLEEALGLTCSIETDGACAAIGELLHGRGRDLRTFFLIHIGHGLGGGAIIDGNLYRGPHGNASKPGSLFPYDQPRPSGQDLIEYLQEEGVPVADIADLEQIMKSHAGKIDVWMERAARQLADVVRITTAFLDPEIVVLGGRLPVAINDELAKRVQQIDLPGPSRGLPNARILSSSLGPRSGVLGAACIPVFEFLFPGSVESRGNAYVDGRRKAQ